MQRFARENGYKDGVSFDDKSLNQENYSIVLKWICLFAMTSYYASWMCSIVKRFRIKGDLKTNWFIIIDYYSLVYCTFMV